MTCVRSHKDIGYITEQVCTIGVCGALGGIATTMWAIPDGLNFLGPQFQAPFDNSWLSPLFLGGVCLVILASIVSLTAWARLRTRTRESNFIDGQDHGHSHTWVPCRYVLVLFPVGLYWLGLIPAGFSSHVEIDINFEDSGPTAYAKEGEIIRSPRELAQAGYTERSRNYYEGRTAQLVGQVTNADVGRFGLVWYKISCCAADAVPLRVGVHVTGMTPEGNAFDTRAQLAGKWVEVTGVIQFCKLHESDQFITVLEVSAKDVHILDKPPANPFIY